MKTIKLCMSVLLVTWVLSGCSSNKSSSEGLDQLKSEITTLKEENAKLKKEIEALAENVVEPSKAPEEVAEPAPEENQLTVEKNKAITIADFAEMTLTKHQFAKKITPSKPGDFYTYYEAKEEGTTYLAITLKMKSLLTSAKGADEFADVSIKFNDKYDYRTFSTIEDKGGEDFTYTNITSIEPLKSGTLVFLAEVPTEVEKGTEPLKAFITINGSTYEYKIR